VEGQDDCRLGLPFFRLINETRSLGERSPDVSACRLNGLISRLLTCISGPEETLERSRRSSALPIQRENRQDQ